MSILLILFIINSATTNAKGYNGNNLPEKVGISFGHGLVAKSNANNNE